MREVLRKGVLGHDSNVLDRLTCGPLVVDRESCSLGQTAKASDCPDGAQNLRMCGLHQNASPLVGESMQGDQSSEPREPGLGTRDKETEGHRMAKPGSRLSPGFWNLKEA